MGLSVFNPLENYIGNKTWQYKFTSYICKYYPDINFTAYKHDWHYTLMLGERNIITRLVMKIMYDLIFLVLGIVRLLINLRFDGLIWILILYLCLFFSSLWYLYENRAVTVNLS